MANIETLSVSIVAHTQGLVNGLHRAQGQLSKFSASAGGLLGGFRGAAAAFGGGFAIGGLVSSLRETDKLRAALLTVTGSAQASGAAFKTLQGFAAETPFAIGDVVEAFIRLKTLGLDPSVAAITSWGNIASASAKPLGQVIEAVADATIGQFRRLVEFGIQARKEGDNVAFTFQKVTTVVKNNATDIEEYFRKIGDVNFAGAMANRAASLDGALSNLGDSFTQLQTAVGDAGLTSVISELARRMSAWLNEGAIGVGSLIGEFMAFLDIALRGGNIVQASIGAWSLVFQSIGTYIDTIQGMYSGLISNVLGGFSKLAGFAGFDDVAAQLMAASNEFKFDKIINDNELAAGFSNADKIVSDMKSAMDAAFADSSPVDEFFANAMAKQKLLAEQLANKKITPPTTPGVTGIEENAKSKAVTDIGKGLQIDLARTVLTGFSAQQKRVQEVSSPQLAQLVEQMKQLLLQGKGGGTVIA